MGHRRARLVVRPRAAVTAPTLADGGAAVRRHGRRALAATPATLWDAARLPVGGGTVARRDRRRRTPSSSASAELHRLGARPDAARTAQRMRGLGLTAAARPRRTTAANPPASPTASSRSPGCSATEPATPTSRSALFISPQTAAPPRLGRARRSWASPIAPRGRRGPSARLERVGLRGRRNMGIDDRCRRLRVEQDRGTSVPPTRKGQSPCLATSSSAPSPTAWRSRSTTPAPRPASRSSPATPATASPGCTPTSRPTTTPRSASTTRPDPAAIRSAADTNELPVDVITEVVGARPVLLPLSAGAAAASGALAREAASSSPHSTPQNDHTAVAGRRRTCRAMDTTSTLPRPTGTHDPAGATDAPLPTEPVAPGGPRRLARLWRGPADDPRWARPALLGLLLATGVLYLWGLGASGWANSFYSAAVQAGSESWKAFFFGSSDAANSITVDKTPLSLWPMALSVRLFGLSSWSILVPQALDGRRHRRAAAPRGPSYDGIGGGRPDRRRRDGADPGRRADVPLQQPRRDADPADGRRRRRHPARPSRPRGRRRRPATPSAGSPSAAPSSASPS